MSDEYKRDIIEATLKARERDVLMNVLNARLNKRGGLELVRYDGNQFELTYKIKVRGHYKTRVFCEDFREALNWVLDYLAGDVELPDDSDEASNWMREL